MTNYPAEYAPHWSEFDRLTAFRLFKTALGMMTWNPQFWARYHHLGIDLPSAWWMACHAHQMMMDEWESYPTSSVEVKP